MQDFNPREHIDEYLRHELSSDQATAFEAALNEDAELSDEVEVRKDVHDLLEFEARQRLTQAIRDMDKAGTAGRILFFTRPLAVAAALTILLVSTVLLYANLSYSNQAISSKHSAPLEDRVSALGAEDNTLVNAMQFYASENYGEAIARLTTIGAEDPDYHLAQLYLGISYVLTEDHQAAVHVLEPMQELDLNSDVVAWYLSLAYIGNDQPDMARKILKEEEGKGTDYRRSERSKILSELNSPLRKIIF